MCAADVGDSLLLWWWSGGGPAVVLCEILNFKVGQILFLKSQLESRRRYEFIGIFVKFSGDPS